MFKKTLKSAVAAIALLTASHAYAASWAEEEALAGWQKGYIAVSCRAGLSSLHYLSLSQILSYCDCYATIQSRAIAHSPNRYLTQMDTDLLHREAYRQCRFLIQ
jgi:hypothetical protein